MRTQSIFIAVAALVVGGSLDRVTVDWLTVLGSDERPALSFASARLIEPAAYRGEEQAVSLEAPIGAPVGDVCDSGGAWDPPIIAMPPN